MAATNPKPFSACAIDPDKPFVFVSYAHANMEEVYADIKELNDRGYRIWYDEGIPPGTQYYGVIEKAIDRCAYCVAFLSPEAVWGEWVQKEFGYAEGRQKQILPVLLRETKLENGWGLRLDGRQAIYKHTHSQLEYLQRLEASLPLAARRSDGPYPPGSSQDCYWRFVLVQIEQEGGWSDELRTKLLDLAPLFDVTSEQAAEILKQAGSDKAGAVEKFRMLVLEFLKLGPLSSVHYGVLADRAKQLMILGDHWELIVQKEAVRHATALKLQGEREAAKHILLSSVQGKLPQQPDVLRLLETITEPTSVYHLPPTNTARDAVEVVRAEDALAIPVYAFAATAAAALPENVPTVAAPAVATVVAPPATRAETELAPGVSITWLRIPGGLFRRGCPPEFKRRVQQKFPGVNASVLETYPDRTEPLDAFWIARTSITNRQFHVFVKDRGHRYPAGWRGANPPYGSGKDQEPVTGVTWKDAAVFAEWLGARLPNRAEFEKACRGEQGLLYPWGNEFDESRCNTSESQLRRLTDVEAFSAGASTYGVLDLVGNVWEWTADGEGPLTFTVGSSFECLGEVYGVGFFDVRRPPESSEKDLGFRIACTDLRGLARCTLETP